MDQLSEYEVNTAGALERALKRIADLENEVADLNDKLEAHAKYNIDWIREIEHRIEELNDCKQEGK
jgi:hypothetical protein